MIRDWSNFIADRTAVVTGGGGGVGRAIAIQMARAGAHIWVNDLFTDRAEQVCREIEAEQGRATPVTADVCDPVAVAGMVATTGPVDIVVNNAGGSMPGGFLDTSEKSFNQAFHWNVTSAFNLTQLAVPELLKSGGGSVINIASSAGRFNDRGFAAYGTAKAALVHLTANLAADLSPRIRVNAIAPGAIATSALEVVLKNEALESEMKRRTPLGRLGVTEDIAAGALYLASPASGYVTGRVLDIDGGLKGSNLDMGIPDLE